MTELEGATSIDQAVLRRSFRYGLISALRRPDQWQDPQLVADSTIAAPGVGRFDCRAHSDDLYHLLPSRERAVVAAIRCRLRKGATFVDAGANIGFFTIMAGKIVDSHGRVFAIEMIPETANRLRMNVRANGLPNVTIFEQALSEEGGKEFLATVPHEKFGRASIVLEPQGESHHSVAVHSRTIDELLLNVPGTIDLIKMDVEGAEAKVLLGGGQTLRRTNAVIFEQLPGETEAGPLLERSGFRLTMLDERNVLAERI